MNKLEDLTAVAGGPVKSRNEVRRTGRSCAPFIARFIAMSGRCVKIVAGRGCRYAKRFITISEGRITALHHFQLLSPPPSA
jgi:hypothetical protein